MIWHYEMGRIKHIHFVGIGGVGMAGIAEVLLCEGYTISGSDVAENALTKRLTSLGATIFANHAAENIQQADVIVQSSAITPDNPELVAAMLAKTPVVQRAEMLGELMRFRYGIAIAGTHGKTTTTSLISSILAEANTDPTYVIGGKLNSIGTNAKLGAGHFLVAEADESDASFLYLKPMISIITNIDEDHMGTYDNSFEKLQQTFVEFIHKLPFYGLAVLCIDDPIVKQLTTLFSRPFFTYGFSPDAQFCALHIRHALTTTYFTVRRPLGMPDLEVQLNLPGKHNVLNALAAIAVASELKIADEYILSALQKFAGIGRRFQVYGNYVLSNNGEFTLIDDYGHHPREIAATFKAAKDSWPQRNIVMVFQPHRYTRTQDLMQDFCEVLAQVDQLILLNVYAAGEAAIQGAETKDLVHALQTQFQSNVIYVSDHADLPQILNGVLAAGDVLIMQGAGNIGALAAQVAALNKVVNSEC